MAVNDGIDRIDLLAQRIAVFGPLTGAALWALSFGVTGSGTLTLLLFLLITPLVFSILLWVIAWLVEGFLRPRSDPDQDSSRTTG